MNMTKRIWLAVCAAIVLAIGMCSCASVDEGADPVVVHAERTANYALDTFDAFLKFEYENRALINDPAVKGSADGIRKNGPAWIADLRAATRAYKVTRSQTDGDRLQLALTVVQAGLDIAKRYLAAGTAAAALEGAK
jgi:hypothetical protein